MNAELIVDNIIAGFIAVGPDWMVRRVNHRVSTLLRKRTSELEGKLLWTIFPGLRDSDAEKSLRTLASGGRAERRFEFFSPSLYNWFEMWAVRDDGELYIFFQDVTDRARAIQSDAVREALRRVLMDAPVALSITRGPEHRFELMNTASRALLGGRNLEGMTIRNALPEVDAQLFSIIDKVYESGEPVTLRDLEVSYDREGDGELYTGRFDVSYQPMRDTDGVISGIISTSVETTTYFATRRGMEPAG